MNKQFYTILNSPFVYQMAQNILAPGAQFILCRKLNNLHETLIAKPGPILDIGCGPASWLWKVNLKPIGLDIQHEYSNAFQQVTNVAVTGSALLLPFKKNSFGAVFSLGVLHHLKDNDVAVMVQEMLRVCRPGGNLVVMDAVLPQRKALRPLAELIRNLDRGQYMRHEEKIKDLLKPIGKWKFIRYTYTLTGLEMIQGTIKIN
ncbi:hypothetical protein DGMP_17020 [Desulfomarina profundi]|uniref:Methyltransferase type 11 domain-containing protein n=1 Tax=Desulfomarina profundi TaxID=2772557 RepID=A0A8D5JH43_9BACT|nr:class I SAM-dependent methyltransferase [Desulfomarina profundi]BCL61009.1 hypothetical protein DGMP_17020 [Desulfomarina profundi]